MHLLIAEVSKKQDYIFGSLRLRDNITHSANIDKAVSSAYFATINGYSEENMVYSGGGHTVLQFKDKDSAFNFAKALTVNIRKDFVGMELFVKLMPYNEALSPADNINNLCALLAEKKSLRAQSFKAYSFGIDKITTPASTAKQIKAQHDTYGQYVLANDTTDLGGSEGSSNFVAVVHIDGNSMGKRVKALMSNFAEQSGITAWENFKKSYNAFCKAVDRDFKSAFDEMVAVVIHNLENDRLSALNLKVRDNKTTLPIRKIILAGDDVCFVCDGRIGLECANLFLKKLMAKTNEVDGKPYYAAAGVCIVHAKFPFYRAYRLS